jgi:hypothetical protein
MAVTAKAKVTNIQDPGGAGPDSVTIEMGPDYEDGRNKDWAVATPAFSLTMTVKRSVAEGLPLGHALTVTFRNEEE